MNLEEEIDSKKLSDLKVGEKATIISVRDDKDFLTYVEDKNINIGDKIEIIKINSFDMQRTAIINGNERILSQKACDMLYVE